MSATKYRPFLALAFAFLGQAFLVWREIPWTLGPGLGLTLVGVFLFLRSAPPASAGPKPLLFRSEWRWGLGLLLLALFFRLFRLTQVPPGITVEESCGPWLGYALPSSSWPTYYPPALGMTFADIPPAAWAWFHLFTPSHLTYGLFYAFFSILILPFGYSLFRDLAGPRAALLTLFFWGIQLWSVTLGRSGHAAGTSAFYTLAALTLARFAWVGNRPWRWALAGLVAGLGLYAHPAFRACLPLMAFLLLYETFRDKASFRPRLAGLGFFLVVMTATASPALLSDWQSGHWLTGSPKDENFVGQRMIVQKSLAPLWENFTQEALMFQREGSPDAQENLPSHRLLDDVAGPLLVLGLFLALRRWRERPYFYGAAGFLVLSLPAFLSDCALRDSRMLGAAPFAAFLAALAASEAWSAGDKLSSRSRRWVLGLALAAGVVAVAENFKVYFLDRPKDLACWAQADMAASNAGQLAVDLGDRYEYYLSPAFFEKFNVQVLSAAQRRHTHPFVLPESLGPLMPPPDRGLCFILPEGATGVLDLLQRVYPSGTKESWADPWGRSYLHVFRVSAGRTTPHALELKQSWLGTYRSIPENTVLLLQRIPLLNFSHRRDFPVSAPAFSAEWKATLWVKKPGTYRFVMLCADRNQAQLEVDGKPAAVQRQEVSLDLKKGNHALVVRFRNDGGVQASFHLAWKPPNAERYAILPPEALR